MLQISLAAKLRHQSWYLESRSSQHMTTRRHMFQELGLKLGGSIGFGGDKKGNIIDTGTKGNNSFPFISNVLLV